MIKECNRGCGLKIEFRGKTGHAGSTGYFEVEKGYEHTHYRCDRVIEDNITKREKREKEAKEQAKLSDMGFTV